MQQATPIDEKTLEELHGDDAGEADRVPNLVRNQREIYAMMAQLTEGEGNDVACNSGENGVEARRKRPRTAQAALARGKSRLQVRREPGPREREAFWQLWQVHGKRHQRWTHRPSHASQHGRGHRRLLSDGRLAQLTDAAGHR